MINIPQTNGSLAQSQTVNGALIACFKSTAQLQPVIPLTSLPLVMIRMQCKIVWIKYNFALPFHDYLYFYQTRVYSLNIRYRQTICKFLYLYKIRYTNTSAVI